MGPDDFESKAEAALQDLADRAIRESWPENDPRWTPGVKSVLGRIAKESRIDWYATSSEFADDGEWLLDGVAWRKEADGGFRLLFTLESEWEDSLGWKANLPQGVMRDFLKLVVTRSDHRVMVLFARSADAANDRINKLMERAKTFRGSQPGDRYLFACWRRSTKQFVFQLFVV